MNFLLKRLVAAQNALNRELTCVSRANLYEAHYDMDAILVATTV